MAPVLEGKGGDGIPHCTLHLHEAGVVSPGRHCQTKLGGPDRGGVQSLNSCVIDPARQETPFPNPGKTCTASGPCLLRPPRRFPPVITVMAVTPGGRGRASGGRTLAPLLLGALIGLLLGTLITRRMASARSEELRAKGRQHALGSSHPACWGRPAAAVAVSRLARRAA